MAKKRGNGEGSIYRCKDRPGYHAAYTVQTARGPRRRYVSGRTRRKVEEKLTKAERDGGVVFDAKNLTLDEYLDRWLSDSVRGSVKQSTLENYEYVVRLHVVPTLGRTKLNVLTPAHVQALYRSKLDRGQYSLYTRSCTKLSNKP
jgi:integrase